MNYQQTPKIAGQICPNCGQAKLILNPKTGKIFCEKKCWLNNQAAPQTPVQRFNQSLDQDNNDLKWKKINEEKEENIRWCNAINNASLLIAHNPVQGSTDQDIVNRLYMMALRIDNLEPKALTAPQQTMAEPTPIPKHGDQLSDKEIKDIPF